MDCDVCRFSCKDHSEECSKFYPKEAALGYALHFADDPSKRYAKRHEVTSRICVDCKGYFQHDKVVWKELPSGFYSFCPECARRATFIAEKVPVG